MKTQLLNLLAVVACFCWCGCESVRDVSFTARLWHDTDYVVPSPDPKFALSQTPHGILAQYDASYERDGKQRRFAYYVESNFERVAKGQKPVFVDAAKAGPQMVIPVLPRPAVGETEPELYGVYCSSFRTFSLYCRGQEVLGPCNLPVFKDRRETAAQFALTPLAVTADASVAGAAVGVVAGSLWALGHAQGAASNPDGTASNFY